ncbi:MAG: hypothetical protein K8W52_21905 [Deltaproteobacteria bacterium]|nr:hypothetical protein [Deltaproteobacteria bacterium]
MQGSSAALRLPTVATRVELIMPGRAPAAADVFIADLPHQGRTAIALAVAALLDSDAAFVPARGPDGAIVLVGKAALAAVAVSLHEPEPAAEPDPRQEFDWEEPSEVRMLYDQRHDLEVELDRGPTLVGQLLYSSAAERPRVVDHLNQAGGFFQLWTRDTLYVIGKRHVVRVRELVGEDS